MKKFQLNLIALVISFCCIWLLGAIFITSPISREMNKDLGIPTRQCHTVIHHRFEAWANSRLGKYGLEEHDAAKITGMLPKLLVFGDSHVEANMHSWQNRFQNRFSNPAIDCIAIGGSGWSSVEINAAMQKYHEILKVPVLSDVILLTDINDILPPDCKNSFENRKPYWNDTRNPILLKIKHTMKQLHLNFIPAIIKHIVSLKDIDFYGNVWCKATGKSAFPPSPEYIKSYCNELLRTMKQHSTSLVFFYVPHLPYISGNQVHTTDANEKQATLFAQLCAQNQVPFLNLSQPLVQHYSQTKHFCRGFLLSRPGDGHINSDGHQLVADALTSLAATL